MSTARHAFVTGFPGFIARRLVRKLLSADEALQITVLCEASQRDVAEAEIERHRSLDAGVSCRNSSFSKPPWPRTVTSLGGCGRSAIQSSGTRPRNHNPGQASFASAAWPHRC